MNKNPAIHDNIDDVLHCYFHAQLPKAWPSSPVDAELAHPTAPSRRYNARLTLAASIALLLSLGGVLSYAPQSPSSPGSSDLLNGANADGKKLEKHIFPDHQPKLPGTQP